MTLVAGPSCPTSHVCVLRPCSAHGPTGEPGSPCAVVRPGARVAVPHPAGRFNQPVQQPVQDQLPMCAFFRLFRQLQALLPAGNSWSRGSSRRPSPSAQRETGPVLCARRRHPPCTGRRHAPRTRSRPISRVRSRDRWCPICGDGNHHMINFPCVRFSFLSPVSMRRYQGQKLSRPRQFPVRNVTQGNISDSKLNQTGLVI